MTSVNDFFSMPEPDVSRNPATGSPRLIPRGLEHLGEAGRVDYTRASYMADFLEEKDHIHRWEMRYLAKAMGQNEDLAALAAVERYSTGVSDATVGREKTQSGRNLDSIIERAFDRVRLHEKADRGTAVHGFTEPAFWAQEPHEAVPERLRDPVAAFWETNEREAIQIVDTERFTANDQTMSAGTFDHLVRVPGHPVLTDLVAADKKTGNFSPFEWAIQISTYANGEPYDTSNDTRPAWPGHVNTSHGLVWQIDCNPGVRREDRVKLWVIDLEVGWALARLAAEVRNARSTTGLAGTYARPSILSRIDRLDPATALEDLRLLWDAAKHDPKGPEIQALIEQKARTL